MRGAIKPLHPSVQYHTSTKSTLWVAARCTFVIFKLNLIQKINLDQNNVTPCLPVHNALGHKTLDFS